MVIFVAQIKAVPSLTGLQLLSWCVMLFILQVQFWEKEILIIFEPVLSFESESGF